MEKMDILRNKFDKTYQSNHANLATVLVITWIALLLIALLAACGSNDDDAPMTDRFIFGRPPTLIAEADAPPCDFAAWSPYYNLRALCAEMVYDNVTPPEAVPALTSITFAEDGSLYMARTAFGEIWALRDRDGDLFFDDLARVAGGLTQPTGIAAHDGALYVVSLDGITRLDDPDGDGIFDAQTPLVTDLPGAADGNFRAWPGSIAIGLDGRLYVSVRAATSPSLRSTSPAATGLIARYALDGSDKQIVATGFNDPADFAWHPDTGDLWVVDSAATNSSENEGTPPPDELNRIAAATTPGSDYAAATPAFTFIDAQNRPAGVAFYTSDAIPFWSGDLLVAQRGSWNVPEPAGYAVMVVPFDEDANPVYPMDRVAPRDTYARSYDAVSNLSLLGQGFYPYHPVDVAVSAEGWIYVALEEGRILRFRPRPQDNVGIDFRQTSTAVMGLTATAEAQ
ncbi:MAG: hypothetical protein JXA10_04930 [Anaerolineae bacterium]|nr:hypothetical protein [Anaerolineae bacterium]